MQTHIYTIAGTQTIVLRVTDDDGGMCELLVVIVIV